MSSSTLSVGIVGLPNVGFTRRLPFLEGYVLALKRRWSRIALLGLIIQFAGGISL